MPPESKIENSITIFVCAFASDGSGGYEWRRDMSDLLDFVRDNQIDSAICDYPDENYRMALFSMKVDSRFSNDEISEVVDLYLSENKIGF